jgi:hypothetical protein
VIVVWQLRDARRVRAITDGILLAVAVHRNYPAGADSETESLGALEVDLTDIEELVAAMRAMLSADDEVRIAFARGTVDEVSDLTFLHPKERQYVWLSCSAGDVWMGTSSADMRGSPAFKATVRDWASIRCTRRLPDRGARLLGLIAAVFAVLQVAYTAWAIGNRRADADMWSVAISTGTVVLMVVLVLALLRAHGYTIINFRARSERDPQPSHALELVKVGVSIVVPLLAVVLAYIFGLKKS